MGKIRLLSFKEDSPMKLQKTKRERRIFYLLNRQMASTLRSFAVRFSKRYNYAEVRTPIFEHYEGYQSLCRRYNGYRNQGNV